jgi:hypothetical protein
MTGAVLLGSIVIAVLQPAWLTVPLRSAVENAGVAAPILFVLLCATAAPLHLNGVLVRSGARRRHGAVAAPVGRRQEQGADGSRVFVI